MDPDRKRKIRLVVALAAAVLLATALVYTSFSASTEARSPSELLAEEPTGSSQVFGTVVPGSIERQGTDLGFTIADRDDPSATVPVEYTGQVPDPFREGREVIVDGELVNGTLVAEKDSLITKCPSKFSEEAEEDPEHVIIDDSAP
jgi:cytochrome c-type biogenesis protein CcmE